MKTAEEALASEVSLKAAVVADLQQAHRDELQRLKEKDFETQTTITRKNSELVVVRAAGCLIDSSDVLLPGLNPATSTHRG